MQFKNLDEFEKGFAQFIKQKAKALEKIAEDGYATTLQYDAIRGSFEVIREAKNDFLPWYPNWQPEANPDGWNPKDELVKIEGFMQEDTEYWKHNPERAHPESVSQHALKIRGLLIDGLLKSLVEHAVARQRPSMQRAA